MPQLATYCILLPSSVVKQTTGALCQWVPRKADSKVELEKTRDWGAKRVNVCEKHIRKNEDVQTMVQI